MDKRPHLRPGIHLCGMLLLVSAVFGIPPARAHAAGAHITTFYAATKASYDAWSRSNTAPPPPKASVFTSGTTMIAFYFVYGGATPKVTHDTIIIRDHNGATVITHGPYTFTYAAGEVMSYVAAPGHAPYRDGAYSAALVLDGSVAARFSFTVGRSTLRTQPGVGATVSQFYTTSKAGYDTWGTNKNYVPPPQVSSFPSGTTLIAFFFAYKGATAHKTQFVLVIHDDNGKSIDTKGPFGVGYDSGLEMIATQGPNGAAYPDGRYRADLQASGRLIASVTITVGAVSAGTSPVTSVTIKTFYATTANAYDAWERNKYAAPPQLSTFPTGISAMAVYFAYSGARVNVTPFTVILRDAGGATLVTNGPNTLGYATGVEIFLLARTGSSYPNGVYHADLQVANHTAASLTFTVGG